MLSWNWSGRELWRVEQAQLGLGECGR
ncbi:hypothetical protein AA19596_2480 [Acetobacter fabarum DSM 19596]|nr:hypothetical protein AA19596_2480 [Acetobacter fabarum DSM 19596]